MPETLKVTDSICLVRFAHCRSAARALLVEVFLHSLERFDNRLDALAELDA